MESFLPPHANLASYLGPNYRSTLECRHVTPFVLALQPSFMLRPCGTSGCPTRTVRTESIGKRCATSQDRLSNLSEATHRNLNDTELGRAQLLLFL